MVRVALGHGLRRLDLDLESYRNAGRAGSAAVYTDAMARGQGHGRGLRAWQRTGVGTVVPSLLGLLFCSDLVEEAPLLMNEKQKSNEPRTGARDRRVFFSHLEDRHAALLLPASSRDQDPACNSHARNARTKHPRSVSLFVPQESPYLSAPAPSSRTTCVARRCPRNPSQMHRDHVRPCRIGSPRS